MKELLTCVMDIGEQMLVCGAEVHRVEDSIQRMGLALGAKRVDIFIITSSMVVTVYTQSEEALTQTRRITGTGTNMELLHRLNALSRKICRENMDAQQIQKEFQAALEAKNYPFWLQCLACAMIAGSFTLFFGGGLADALVSFFVGALVKLLSKICEKAITSRMFDKFLCAFVACMLAFLAMRLSLVSGVDKIIIGNIMSLIPGIGLTNALRDLFTGDHIAGLLRTIEAGLIALVIAAGYFLSAILMGGV